MELTDILFLGVFILAGIVMLYFAITSFKRIQLIRNSDEVSIHEAVNRDDIVQINGKAKKYKEILNSPLEDKDCFAYDYTIEKRTRRRSSNGRSRKKWRTVESGNDDVDFILEDNSGTAYIHTDGAEKLLDTETQYSMSNSSSIPSTVKENNNLSFDLMGFSFRQKLRLREGTLQPDDDVFVIGKYTNRNSTNDETIEIDAEEKIYISDKNTKKAIRSLIIKVIIYSIIGIMFTLMPIIIILSEFGLI